MRLNFLCIAEATIAAFAVPGDFAVKEKMIETNWLLGITACGIQHLCFGPEYYYFYVKCYFIVGVIALRHLPTLLNVDVDEYFYLYLTKKSAIHLLIFKTA